MPGACGVFLPRPLRDRDGQLDVGALEASQIARGLLQHAAGMVERAKKLSKKQPKQGKRIYREQPTPDQTFSLYDGRQGSGETRPPTWGRHLTTEN